MGKSGWRVMEAGGIEWSYKFGHQNVVIKNTSTGKKHIIDYSTLTGRDWNTIDRGEYKGTTDGMMTPGHVLNYILKNLVEETK